MPKLTEAADMRFERRRMVVEREKKKAEKNVEKETADSSLHTCAVTEKQEHSPHINGEGDLDRPNGEAKEDFVPELATVGTASD
jgi:hypothetical protein